MRPSPNDSTRLPCEAGGESREGGSESYLLHAIFVLCEIETHAVAADGQHSKNSISPGG